MKREEGRGPVVFVALYVAALVLTWLTLFSFERFGETDVRSWSPLLQAVLSAAAIFSAWWLQDRKRRADREEVQTETVAALLQHVFALEWSLSRTVMFCRDGRLRPRTLKLIVPAFSAALDAIRKLNVGHMPTPAAVRAVVVLQHNATLALAALESAHESEEKYLPLGEFDVNWKQVFRSRTKVLKELGATAEAGRIYELPPIDFDEAIQDDE